MRTHSFLRLAVDVRQLPDGKGRRRRRPARLASGLPTPLILGSLQALDEKSPMPGLVISADR